MRQRFAVLMSEYGKIAIGTYLVLFVLVLAGFGVAIAVGLDVGSPAGSAGTLGAAYVATKLTQPLRIGATLALTPLVARLLGRLNWDARRPPSL